MPFGTEMLYLSSIMDLYNNEIIAYEISNRQDVTFVLKTVEKTIKSQQKTEVIKPLTLSKRYLKEMALTQACPVKEIVMIMPQ
ncbi:hypothetical protein PDQ36_29460 [Bacillus cereus]|nr:hypothetical protein [Bacillus cereus]